MGGKTTKYREFDRIERLRRRAEWLQKRIEMYKQGKHAWDRGELSALEWAIPILEDYMIDKTMNNNVTPELRKAFGFKPKGEVDG